VHRGSSSAKHKVKRLARASRVVARKRFGRPGYDRCPAARSEPSWPDFEPAPSRTRLAGLSAAMKF